MKTNICITSGAEFNQSSTIQLQLQYIALQQFFFNVERMTYHHSVWRGGRGNIIIPSSNRILKLEPWFHHDVWRWVGAGAELTQDGAVLEQLNCRSIFIASLTSTKLDTDFVEIVFSDDESFLLTRFVLPVHHFVVVVNHFCISGRCRQSVSLFMLLPLKPWRLFRQSEPVKVYTWFCK